MKALLIALLLIPTLAHADLSVPRSKQYLYTQYDVSVSGGASTAHNLGATLPSGAIVTDVWVYINTQFAAGGTESLGIQCAGTLDLMAYNSIKNIAQQKVLQAHLGATNMGATGNNFIGESASANADNLSAFGSIPSDCAVTAVVRGDSGYTPFTAGKATVIVEYFRQ
jgi:hypothetical protein